LLRLLTLAVPPDSNEDWLSGRRSMSGAKPKDLTAHFLTNTIGARYVLALKRPSDYDTTRPSGPARGIVPVMRRRSFSEPISCMRRGRRVTSTPNQVYRAERRSGAEARVRLSGFARRTVYCGRSRALTHAAGQAPDLGLKYALH
jgi:hypothetical protein